MKLATLSPSQDSFGPPVPCSQEHCKRLEIQITELSAHIHAATYRLLELIREYDDSHGWSRGEVSYSKVRAMTRVATEKNEEYLLQIARHGTAAHVERLLPQGKTY